MSVTQDVQVLSFIFFLNWWTVLSTTFHSCLDNDNFCFRPCSSHKCDNRNSFIHPGGHPLVLKVFSWSSGLTFRQNLIWHFPPTLWVYSMYIYLEIILRNLFHLICIFTLYFVERFILFQSLRLIKTVLLFVVQFHMCPFICPSDSLLRRFL